MFLEALDSLGELPNDLFVSNATLECGDLKFPVSDTGLWLDGAQLGHSHWVSPGGRVSGAEHRRWLPAMRGAMCLPPGTVSWSASSPCDMQLGPKGECSEWSCGDSSSLSLGSARASFLPHSVGQVSHRGQPRFRGQSEAPNLVRSSACLQAERRWEQLSLEVLQLRK